MPLRQLWSVVTIMPILCALPTLSYAQSVDSAAFELGGTFSGFVVLNDDPTPYPAFGGRATFRTSTLWAVQFDVDMPMAVTRVGRYGVRARYWPESSAWYGFAAVAGTFVLAEEGTYYERPGGFRWPNGVRYGAGRQLFSHGRWKMLFEEELACSVYGGVTLSAGVEVRFGARRASGR